jgi:soluble lytic murein transglycosylase-like protein
MIDPILSRLQYDLLQAAIDNLEQLLAGNGVNLKLDPSKMLQARTSEFDEMITEVARRNGVDEALLKAVVQTESNFTPTAVSSAGAKGLMQLMDGTAQHQGVANVFDPAENLTGGAKFLRQMLSRYQGNEVLALAAYNAGPGAVDQWGGIPPYQETQTYIPRVLNLRDQYREWKA